MLRKYRYARELKNLAKSCKKDYVSSVIHANLGDDKHIMFMKEELSNVYPSVDEYSILEKVDLIDFRKFYGRNKKRRSLLCRP